MSLAICRRRNDAGMEISIANERGGCDITLPGYGRAIKVEPPLELHNPNAWLLIMVNTQAPEQKLR